MEAVQFFIFLALSVTFHVDMAALACPVSEMFLAFSLGVCYPSVVHDGFREEKPCHRARQRGDGTPQRGLLGFARSHRSLEQRGQPCCAGSADLLGSARGSS